MNYPVDRTIDPGSGPSALLVNKLGESVCPLGLPLAKSQSAPSRTLAATEHGTSIRIATEIAAMTLRTIA